jgi:hypothetical protein
MTLRPRHYQRHANRWRVNLKTKVRDAYTLPWSQCSSLNVEPPAILRDARDPQLHANLNRLGPVRVDHHMQTVRTVRQLHHMCT